MANPEHVRRLQTSNQEKWNAWREGNPEVVPDLSDADLAGLGADKHSNDEGFDLRRCNFDGANLAGANLTRALLDEASLHGANLSDACLTFTSLVNTRITDANLHGAQLYNVAFDDEEKPPPGLELRPSLVTCFFCQKAAATVQPSGDDWGFSCPDCGLYALAPADATAVILSLKQSLGCRTTPHTVALDYQAFVRVQSDRNQRTRCEHCALCGSWACQVRDGNAVRWLCRVCGPYTAPVDDDHLIAIAADDRQQLTWALRRAYDAGKTSSELTARNVEALIAAVRAPSAPLDSINQVVSWMFDHGPSDGEFVELDRGDYPIAYATGGPAFDYYLCQGVRLGWIEMPEGAELGPRTGKHYRLTLDGWQRALELRGQGVRNRQVFVAMSFGDEFRDAWKNGLEKGIKAAGLEPLRIDDVQHGGKICDLLVAEIRRSSVVVADCSTGSGNVYFEAGFATGLGIPVIWTCRRSEEKNLQFDTRQYPHILWDGAEDLCQQIHARLEATIVVTGS